MKLLSKIKCFFNFHEWGIIDWKYTKECKNCKKKIRFLGMFGKEIWIDEDNASNRIGEL